MNLLCRVCMFYLLGISIRFLNQWLYFDRLHNLRTLRNTKITLLWSLKFNFSYFLVMFSRNIYICMLYMFVQALTIAPKNSKALFRRGQACNFLNRFDDALVDLNGIPFSLIYLFWGIFLILSRFMLRVYVNPCGSVSLFFDIYFHILLHEINIKWAN